MHKRFRKKVNIIASTSTTQDTFIAFSRVMAADDEESVIYLSRFLYRVCYSAFTLPVQSLLFSFHASCTESVIQLSRFLYRVCYSPFTLSVQSLLFSFHAFCTESVIQLSRFLYRVCYSAFTLSVQSLLFSFHAFCTESSTCGIELYQVNE